MEIERLEEEICRWDARACKVTPNLGIAGGAGDDRIQSCVDKIVELQNQLTQQMKLLVAIRNTIEQAILSVPDMRLQVLLKLRYINGLRWEEIASRMHYEVRWVQRLHGKALTKLTIEDHTKSVLLLS